MKPDYKLVAKAKYIHMTADLASEIWHEVYKRYFPAKQLDALVESLQSADAIEEDIDNDVNYFLVFLGSSLIGYFAWKMENTSLHLLHLYLKPEYRGKGIASQLIEATIDKARTLGLPAVGLLVDKGNPKAEKLYSRIGFVHVDDSAWGGHAMKHMQYKL